MIIPTLTENSLKVLEKRYLDKDSEGRITETPTGLFQRTARHIASADAAYGLDPARFERVAYEMMARLDFLPNTPCLANAGKPNSLGQLSACFVIPVEDDMRSIMHAVSVAAFIQQSGGGTGFAFSRLRPEGDFVKSTSGVASGPVSFMSMFNAMTEHVKQGGIRRGANMGVLRVDHPDILAFIDCKQDVTKITNFNISVGVTNAFMTALTENGEYDLVNPRSKLVTRRLSARKVWEKICENAWRTAEPGVVFIDRVNELDPLSHVLGDIEATNPCGEVPLRAYVACTLGSINLGNFFVRKSAQLTTNVGSSQGTVDFERLRTTIHHATHFLDNVLDKNVYPVPEFTAACARERKIGLGVMGWADLLIKLGLPYDSDEALGLAEQLAHFVNTEAVSASEQLVDERGPFPLWSESRWCMRGDKPRRNSTVTVEAPTGSISIIAGCSSGIEPLFALVMERNQAGMKMHETHPEFAAVLGQDAHGHVDRIRAEVARVGSCQGIASLPQNMRAVFRTAMDIPGPKHVLMQAAWQKHFEDGVSKTINMPKTTTAEEVAEVYQLAWDTGCKGITVYRDGCRPEQVLSTGATATIAEAVPEGPIWTKTRRRIPADGYREGATVAKATAYGNLHCTINVHPDDGEPFECFAALAKEGAEVMAFAAALGRASSLLLSVPSPMSPRERLRLLAEQLAGIGGGGQAGLGEGKILSVPDGISKAIYQWLNQWSPRPIEAAPGAVAAVASGVVMDVCPECGKPTLTKGGKCDLCINPECGYSKC